MKPKIKKTVVIHSGGMDSSICLALAIKEYGKENVISLTFSYHQRHSSEVVQAKKICEAWNVDQKIVLIDYLKDLTNNALINKSLAIDDSKEIPNTEVVGRNGLMARLGAIFANHLGANSIYMGIIGIEANFSGYKDCSREYMDLKQEILRIDLGNPQFEIKTPLVHLTKKETLDVANKLGILDFLLENTVTCYEGLIGKGCKKCPACLLRNKGLEEFLQVNKK